MPAGALYWLGPPRVEVDGQTVRLETRKITALLALLSVDHRPHSRERIAAIFWPEFDSVRAPANLRRVLSSLRKSLGEGWLKVDRDTLEFLPDGTITVDYVDFIAVVRDVRASLSGDGAGLKADSARKLRDILTLYKGDFLEGFNLKDCPEFDSWQTIIREELFNNAGWALERLVEIDSAAGRLKEAVG